MSLIDLSYFVGELNIPNIDRPAVAEPLNYFIKSNEAKMLRDVLGYPLWKAFTDGIAVGSPEQKWLDLRDGKEYSYFSNYTEKWDGIKFTVDTEGTMKKSMIANYVYCQWMRDKHTQSAGQGEQKAKQINADNANPDQKIARAWNEMIDWIKSMICYLDRHRETYPEWIKQNRYLLRKNYWYINVFGI